MISDQRRLAALENYQIIDSEPEHEYDSITRLASHICKVPVALISFIDDRRQWMKSIIGLDIKEAPLEIAICRYTIENPTLLEIKDTLVDSRFSEYPHISGPPGVRFYAGQPLTTPEGQNIGTICVIDFQPRQLDDHQREALKILSEEVIAHLEVSKKKRELEDMLKKATEFQHLFNNSNEIHCIANEEGIIEFINESVFRLLGYKAADVLGKSLWEFNFAGEKERVMPGIHQKTAEGENSLQVETRVLTKTGEIRWFEWSNVKINGKWLVNGRDVTSRRESLNKLKTLSLAVEKSAAGVIIRDSELQIEWMNAASEQILGYRLAELQGKGFGELLIGEQTDLEILRQAQKSIAEKQPYEIEIVLYKKDRTPIWLFISNNPLLDERGEIEKQVSVIVDITMRKHAEEQLIKTRQDAIDLSKAKESFLSVMSHEMRTPLNAVIGMTNILMEEEPLERQEENLNILKFSAENLLTLINDVLDFTKIETGNLQLERRPLNIRELAIKTIESLKFKTSSKGIGIAYEIEDSIPEHILGDSTRLYQIFVNLLGNAVKFTEKGEVKLKLELERDELSTVHIRFEVSDSGIGISADKLASIFDAYTQAEMDTSRKYGGTGLGLAISQKLVLLHQSTIEVKSALGKGSTFSFSISFPKVTTAATPVVAEKPVPLMAHLLVVDDNAVNRLLAKKVLDKWSVKVDLAEDGLEAVAKVKETNYDMVLMDIHMPVMGGFEAVKVIRSLEGKKFQDLPIIALTGSVGSNDEERFKSKGMDAYVLKPFEPSALYNTIKPFLLRERDLEFQVQR